MIAAFIISIRGTLTQALLLGLSAAFSHTLVIWVLAGIRMHFSEKLDVKGLESWFQLGTGVIIIGMVAWMFMRIRREQKVAATHDHQHGARGGIRLDTGQGLVEISVFETGVRPRFRLHFFGQDTQPVNPTADETVTLETIRSDGTREAVRVQILRGLSGSHHPPA